MIGFGFVENKVTLRSSGLVAVVGLVALGCAQDYHVEFPSWEPTSAKVPLVTDRSVALRYLDESWVLWQRYGAPDYTYTRAYQESPDAVVFVVSTVKDGAVQRMTTLETSLDGLGDVEKYRSGDPLRVVVDERGGAEDSHTIPELYQRCRTQIAQQDFAGVRLYFHHWGLLQHCGYLNEECEDCETVSIHSYYPHAVPDQAHVMEFFCPDRPGLLPFNAFVLRGCDECHCTPVSDVAKAVHAGFGASPAIVAKDERRGYRARWDNHPRALPATAVCPTPAPLKPSCVGKPAPLADPPQCMRHAATIPAGWQGFDSFRK